MAASPSHSEAVSRTFLAAAAAKVKTRGLRYSMVSVVNVIVGQGLLFLFFGVFGWGATRSNVAAVLLSAVPAYYLNRYWVWGKRGRSHFRKEVLPFLTFVIIGLVLSTLAVTVATAWTVDHLEEGTLIYKALPNLANITAFGILWVLRFFIFDKLFHLEADADYEPTDPLGEHDHT